MRPASVLVLTLGAWAAGTALALAESAASCRPDFILPDYYGVTPYAAAIQPVDVNEDGLMDLVMSTGSTDPAIAVRLGSPDGTFGPPISLSTFAGSPFFVVGTFDAGSAPDLVLSTFNGIVFFTGNGDGTFQNGVYVSDLFLRSLAAADFNDDGELDVFGFGTGLDTLVVLLGNGDGTFQDPVSTPAPLGSLDRAVGDLDGDGFSDAVVVNGNDGVYVFLAVGDGSFQDAAFVPAGQSIQSVALAPLDAGDTLDLIVPSSPFEIGALLGNGDGTFQAVVLSPTAPFPDRVAAGDFDGDSIADLAVTSSGAGVLQVLTGVGNGTFVEGAAYAIDADPQSIVAAPFGDSPILDLAVGTGMGLGRISVLEGHGDGTFRAVRLSWADPYPDAWVQADFDEDGSPDVALGRDGFRALLGTGDGAFRRGPIIGPFVDSLSGMAASDIDGDGHEDLALLLAMNSEIPILLGQGDGTFVTGTPLTIPTSPFLYTALVAADFDGDGLADLAAADIVAEPAGSSITVFLRQPGGGFGSPTVNTVPFLSTRLMTADFNGDGYADVAMLDTSFPKAVQILIGLGNGSFEAPVAYPTGPLPVGIAAGDLRNSGHLDLVISDQFESNLWVYDGAGNGTFAAPRHLGIGAQASFVAVSDINGDGNQDVVTANLSNTSHVLVGLGNGAFQSPLSYAPGIDLSGILTGDYDRNGLTDILFVTRSYPGGVTTLLNGGLGALVSNVSVLVGSAAELAVTASGFGSLTYQWRKDGVPLADGGPISGVTTATLTIDPVAFADAGSYDVLVTDSCGTLSSGAGTLSVEFADVASSSPFHDDIIAIATAGITGGCGGANYCPTSPVRRDQMAVFLLKAEHGSAYTPPACSGIFADVPCPSAFADWIEQLAAEGVTGGCGGANYCPDSSVTRAQMAVFLLKTSDGSGYTPPPATGIFGDVPVGSFAADFIEELYGRGITGGCSASPLLYCPGNPVLRQQMATFLARTFLP